MPKWMGFSKPSHNPLVIPVFSPSFAPRLATEAHCALRECLAYTRADIYRSALAKNYHEICKSAQNAGVFGVVKANAYGHGAVEVARVLIEEGVEGFCVALPMEGIELREAGITAPILVMGAPLIHAISVYADYKLDLNISSLWHLKALCQAMQPHQTFNIHLKVDTGMRRLGLQVEELAAAMALLDRFPRLNRRALWTHFAVSDESENPFTQTQIARFKAVTERYGDTFESFHLANSAGILNAWRGEASEDRLKVRAGLSLYGYDPRSSQINPALKPVMRVSSQISHLKKIAAETPLSYGQIWTAKHTTGIATVAMGYADGFARAFSNLGWVGIQGQKYPVVGRVCMDMFMVEVGLEGLETLQIGDEVLIWGDEGIYLPELAARIETIPYTLLTALTARVPRFYHD